MAAREGVQVIRSIDELQADEAVFLIGGAQLFELLLPQCESVYLTWVEQPYDGMFGFLHSSPCSQTAR